MNPDRTDLPVETMPRLCMVGWYDPAQLFRTGIQVVVSTLFGRHSDARRLDTLSSKPPIIDYRHEKYLDDAGCFGFDYVADTGDGWNSTYAVAYAVSQQHCAPSNHPPLPRGTLLVMGGDLVYPYPTRQLYENRLVAPYSVAGQLHNDEPVEVLAIPGNHDWYDSLVNFRRLFCCQRMMGFRQTRQTRSYFAASLPANWWLFGVDVQLDGDLDESQFKFFSDVVSELGHDQRVILCMPEPVWHERWQRDESAFHCGTLLEHLEKDIGDKLKVCIAGDLHHYQRYSTADNQHRITCGTGGAFLHPTHQIPSDPTSEFNHQRSFPDQEKSRRLSFLNLGFLGRNPLFGIVPAIAYLLAGWQNGFAVGQCFGQRCIKEVGSLGLSQWTEAVYAGVNSALLTPAGFAIYVLIFWGFVFFADRRSKKFCYCFGTVHAAAHIAAGFMVFWFAAYAAITWAELAPKSVTQYLLSGAIMFILGWIVGSLLLGVYLLASLNLFGMHRNDAFSSLRIEDWKGFLRCKIDPDGRLRIRFIGFEKVPRKWETAVIDGRKILRPAREEDFVGEVIDEIDIPGGTARISAKTSPRGAKPRLTTSAAPESVEV